MIDSPHSSVVLAFLDVLTQVDKPCRKGKDHAWTPHTYNLMDFTTGATHIEQGLICVYCREGLIGRDDGPDVERTPMTLPGARAKTKPIT